MHGNEIWKAQGFEVVITGDGSPSLKALQTPKQEAMHHSGGAWSETRYIYGVALEAAKKFLQEDWWVASVGLGLGYNEILTSLMAPRSARLASFETESFLLQNFQNWCREIDTGHPAQEVMKKLQQSFPGQDPRIQLRRWQDEGQWQIVGKGLSPETLQAQSGQKWNVILYDAFSAETSPGLWEQDFLESFLQNHVSEEAVFSTYACRGSLKRALKRTGFQFFERQGFQGKRNASFGWRSPQRKITTEQFQDFLKTCECIR